MAMGLLRKKVDDSADWRIESAGTWSILGEPPAWNTQLILDQRGINVRDHRSRPVDRDLLKEFKLILVMEAGHKEALQVEFPEIADQVYLVSEMVGASYNILDPMGNSLESFEETAREFEQILDQGFNKISLLAKY
jgi:protein-tyrosine-phosphatase